MNAELITFLTAAVPVSELRGALPLGMSLGLTPASAYFFAVLGNSVIILPVLLFLRYGAEITRRYSKTIDRVLTWAFERTRRKYGAQFEGASMLALAVFVAIPLPMTGAWTACIIAVLFNLPLWKSAGAIVLGVLAAGGIVLALTQGIITIF